VKNKKNPGREFGSGCHAVHVEAFPSKGSEETAKTNRKGGKNRASFVAKWHFSRDFCDRGEKEQLKKRGENEKRTQKPEIAESARKHIKNQNWKGFLLGAEKSKAQRGKIRNELPAESRVAEKRATWGKP